MAIKVGVVGINLDFLSKQTGLQALKASGNNFGNMLFTTAVYNQIKHTSHLGFNFDTDRASRDYNAIVVPAANWVNLKQDWGWLASNLEETSLPVTMIGLGSQLENLDQAKDVPEGTQKLLKIVSQRSASIAVRGEFTAEVLSVYGIQNVEVLGCPSMFCFTSFPQIRKKSMDRPDRLAIGPTRYGFPDLRGKDKSDGHRQLYQFALRNASSIYYQSEAFEIGLLDRQVDKTEIQKAQEYYGVPSFGQLEGLVLDKGKYHTSVSSWVNDIKKEDLYVGTRIHGAVAAILAGTPAVLLTHDNRTAELADVMCIPHIPLEQFSISSLYDLHGLWKQFDVEKFLRRSTLNGNRLMQFFKANNLDYTSIE